MTQHDPQGTDSVTLDTLVAALSDWHRQQAVAETDASAVSEAQDRRLTACLDALGERLKGDEDQLRLRALGGWLRESAERLAPQLQARLQRTLPHSWARKHGSLRLVDETRVLLAQAIDRPAGQLGIDERQDPAEDVASLLVGLEMADRQELARDALDGYLRHSGDYHMARLLSLYQVLASLRGAWLALCQDAVEAPGDVPPSAWLVEHLGLARRYLSLAERHAEFRFPPLVIGVGVSGSGKSRFTRTLVRRLGAVRLESHSERCRMHASCSHPDGSSDAGDKYSAQATARTYQRLAQCSGWLLDGGFPVCVDSTCLTRDQRRQLWQQAERRGLPVLLVSFEADEATLKRRIAKRAARHAATQEESLAVLEAQQAAFEPFDDEERLHLVRLDTTAENVSETLAALIQENIRFC
ncbi:MAG TPA: AAA family ATPase [Halomonas sp.]|nr:AAA family ATPase [Halomonas sp.]